MSIRAGQSPSIQDEQCDLTLPLGYEEGISALLSSNMSNDINLEVSLYLSDLRLTKIKSRAYRTLYAHGINNRSDAEHLKLIRELDADLEAWRLSIPASHRPSLSDTFQAAMNCHPLADTLPVMLRMDYHHCIAIIHHAAGRCKAWPTSGMDTLDGICSSFALAVEASRSSIYSLESAMSVLPLGCYWYVSPAPFLHYCSPFHIPSDTGIGTVTDNYQAICFLPCVSCFDNLLQHPSSPP